MATTLTAQIHAELKGDPWGQNGDHGVDTSNAFPITTDGGIK